MGSCDKDFSRELIRDEILKMIQEGLLQPSVHDCNGNRIGQWARVLVCGDNNNTPTPGVDNDTKNKNMTWSPLTQDVSVVDTSNNSVSTKILFNTTTPPPVNVEPEFTEYFGEDIESVLSSPGEWIAIKSTDGSVFKVPVYFDDVVNIDRCPPLSIDHRAFHMRTKYKLTPENGSIEPAEASPLSLDDKFTAYDIFTLVNGQLFDQGSVFYENDYIYTTMGWVKYSDIKNRDSGEITTYGVIWEKNSSGAYTKSFEFPLYRLSLDRATGKAELYKVSGVAPPCGVEYPEFKVTLHGWYAAGIECAMHTRYATHEYTIPLRDLIPEDGQSAFSGIMASFFAIYQAELLKFTERLEALEQAYVNELSGGVWITHSKHGVDLIESPFGIMEDDHTNEYIYKVYHTTETTITQEGLDHYTRNKAYKLEPAVDNGHRLTLASTWKWTDDNPGLYAM